MSEKIPLLVELGLQTVHDETAMKIGRGHDFAAFCDGFRRLRAAGGDIQICIHLIDGLPGESLEMMLDSARSVAALEPDMVKLHLLHVLRGTPLARQYLSGDYTPMSMEAYTDTAVRQLELLPPDTVIARVTGDAPAELLLAPDWCRKKTAVSNEIDRLMYGRRTYQGALFTK